jgi:WD40 repeat protein/CHAT domain-containing protein
MQAFGGQLAVFLGNESVEFSSDSSRILTFKKFAIAKYLSEYPRLWDTKGNLLAVLRHENNQIKSAIFNPDGQQVLTTDDRNVRLWDRNGNLLTVFSHKDFFSAQFSPDSRYILTIAKRDARLWNRRGKLLAVLQYERSEFQRAIFSPDSHRILTIDELNFEGEGVRLWDKAGNLLTILETTRYFDITNAIFSPDGKYIITENDEFTNSGYKSYLWDKEGNLLTAIRMECRKVSGIIFSPDGNYLLARSDHTVCLWDKKGNFIKEFLHHQRKISSLEFSPDGRHILTKSGVHSDQIASLWDLEGNLLATLPNRGVIYSLQFSPDGRHILIEHDTYRGASLWDLEGKTVAVLQNKGQWISDPVFSPDGNYILAKSGNVALLWDKQGNPLAVIQGHAGESIDGAVFSPDGRYILTTNKNDDETSRLWDVSAIIAIQMQQRSALQTLEGEVANHNAQLTQVRGSVATLSPDGQYILTAGAFHDREARLWDIRGNLLTVFSGHSGPVSNIAFSSDGNYILTSDVSCHIWNREGELLALGGNINILNREGSLSIVWRKHDGLLKEVEFGSDRAFFCRLIPFTVLNREGNQLGKILRGNVKVSPDGRHIIDFDRDKDNIVRLLDAEGNLLTVFRGPESSIRGAIFSPDGNLILTRSSDKTARLWDLKGNLLTVFQGHDDSVYDATFSPDGSRILTAGGVTARLWDTQGNLLKVLQGHEDLIFVTTFSPDGNLILTASRDNTARLWDREGNPLAIFRGHEIFVTDAEFTPDGRHILTTSLQDDTTRLWDVSAAIAAHAEQVAALRTSHASVSNKNTPQADAALQAAIQLNQQGTIESRQQALQKLEEALKLYRADNNAAKAAHTLLLMGNIHGNLGQFQTALDSYSEALPLSRQSGAKAEEAAILNSLGELYNNLADPKTALDYHKQALPLLYQLNDKGSAAKTFNNIGDIQTATEQWENALSSYNKALIISRPAGDLTAEATALMGIGNTYIASKEWSTALNAYNQSLLIARYLKDKTKETTILNQMGKIYAALGQNSTAIEHYNQALALAQQLGYKTEEANILYNQAIFNRQQNNLTAAKTEIETAINIIESLRTQIASQQLRQSYFARNQDYYQFYIDLLMQLHQQTPDRGYDALALHISERARARILLEQLTEASLDLKADLDPALKAEEKRLNQALNAADRKRIDLLQQFDNTKLEEVKAEIDNILNQLQNLEVQIRSANPAYANLKYPEPLTLHEIQNKILDDKTLLLQYALGKDRSYLFLVSKTALKTYKLPPKAEIETAVEQYRELLLSPDFKDLSQGQNLSQMLLGQIAGELKGQRLVIIGDGKLQLLPFAALPWGSGASLVPLLKNHEIITLPSATSLAVQREQWQKRQQAPRTLAVIADPVFQANDPRLGANTTTTRPGDLSQQNPSLTGTKPTSSRASTEQDNEWLKKCGNFDRLPYTATEAQQILALVPDAQEFSALGFDANYATATNRNLRQYRIVHLATHGCIQDNPLLSNLALSFFNANGQKAETSLLKLQDIYNLELNADLVVLSACQTGTGKEVQGEGVVGLTRGFMYAGARRVAVSLWSVNDRATSILMSDYYRKMLEQKVDPAAALRQAQLAMWQSDSYSAPYYWAAFTLQGDW